MEKLAIEGGPKAVMPDLPGRFSVGLEEKAALDVLFDKAAETGKTPGYSGPEEEAFCQEFAALYGVKHADGVNSGTNSVYVALKALNLPLFSEVVVGCVTDPGGMMPIVAVNCIPVPADTEPDSMNAGAEQIEARITERTSAILVAHIGGEPADMPAIMKVAEKYNLPVVEDNSQSHLATINGKYAGTFGRYGAFSLMFGKLMCVGGQGGAVICNSDEDYWAARRAADRGKPFGLPAGSTNCVASLNCNMDEVHATIGRVQIKKVAGIVARRQAAVAMLRKKGLEELQCVSIPQLRPGFVNTYWFWWLKFEAEKARCTKEEYCAALIAEGVDAMVDYSAGIPPTQTWFQNRCSEFPWNNPLYKGDAGADYPIPNALRNNRERFRIRILESFGETETDQIAEAFRKVDAFYRK